MKRPVIILMTLMVMSFSLGSLINFHLNRIYGNPLATDLIFSKKDEKSTSFVKQAPLNLFSDGIMPDTDLVPEQSILIISKDYSCFVIPSFISTGNPGYGLRGPPLA